MDRIDQIFVQIKPDTLNFWKSVFSVSVAGITMVPSSSLIIGALVSAGRQRPKEE